LGGRGHTGALEGFGQALASKPAATSGPDLERSELTGEAIRLTSALHRLLPEDGEVAGLLALMLLTNGGARRVPAPTAP
jgi:predicted RNA polymerase sigma factor